MQGHFGPGGPPHTPKAKICTNERDCPVNGQIMGDNIVTVYGELFGVQSYLVTGSERLRVKDLARPIYSKPLLSSI